LGPVEVLEVIDHSVDQDQAATQGGRCEQERGEEQPSPEPCCCYLRAR
jgi:hypothetical protein